MSFYPVVSDSHAVANFC